MSGCGPLEAPLLFSSGEAIAETVGTSSLAKVRGTLSINTWQHTAVARRGTNFRTYRNGSNVSSFTASGSFNNGSALLYFAANGNTGAATNVSIDEVALWKGMSFADNDEMDDLASARYNSGTGSYLV